jgi:tetratricopeptide (TPR) repeat protein
LKLRIAVFFIALLWPVCSFAADDVGALLDKALDQLVKAGYAGDTSAAERYLQAILERQPDHLEAQWQLIYIQLSPLINTPLSQRASVLSTVSPAFDRLAKLAKQSKKQAFLHYITARYASYYDAYERALSEIGKALALEPRSVRYLTAKGGILVGCGCNGMGTKRDAEIEKGIRVLKQARELLQRQPSRFVRDEHYDFYLAAAIANLSRPRWKEVTEHYRRFIERSQESQESVIYAFAWNNASIAYRELGECDKAKEAAEKALKVMKFGAAESNKRYAEFCIEIQKMGLLVKKE